MYTWICTNRNKIFLIWGDGVEKCKFAFEIKDFKKKWEIAFFPIGSCSVNVDIETCARSLQVSHHHHTNYIGILCISNWIAFLHKWAFLRLPLNSVVGPLSILISHLSGKSAHNSSNTSSNSSSTTLYCKVPLSVTRVLALPCY